MLKPRVKGGEDRFKARLVACGYEQKEGIDYHETFASVVKWGEIRTITTLAAQGWNIHQMDVKTHHFERQFDRRSCHVATRRFSVSWTRIQSSQAK